MRYLGTEKVVCPACEVELDVPLYQVDEVKHYGMKFCHQCGNSLFYKSTDNDLKDIVLSIREGVKAMYHYSDDQVKAYWQGVDDCCKEYDKLSSLNFDKKAILKHLDSLCICVGNAYDTSHWLLESDMEFIEKQIKFIKELLTNNKKGSFIMRCEVKV